MIELFYQRYIYVPNDDKVLVNIYYFLVKRVIIKSA